MNPTVGRSGNEETMKVLAALVLLGLAASAGRAGRAQAVATTPAVAQSSGASASPAVLTEATPAMWKIKGAHGTLYLFGSIHVMKKDVRWETAKVKDALGASDTLYLEIAGLDDASLQAAQPQILQMGTDSEHPLSTKISKDDVALLDGAVKGMGLPGEQALESMQPWLVYLTISVLPAIQAGYDPSSGVDKTLDAEEKQAGKPVKGFETMTEQMHFVADMPLPLQAQMLHQALVDLPKSVSQTDEMVADWTRGDVEAIAKLDNDEMKVKYPDLYDRLLVKRNERFADALAGLLKDPATGTVFVTIGAGHLAGPDSVLKMLETRGYAAVRVE
jgi:uncharacterized protein YbaP (TraB family)